MSDKKEEYKICPLNDEMLCSSKCGLYLEDADKCSITDIAISLDSLIGILKVR